jgi:hypothetical protein
VPKSLSLEDMAADPNQMEQKPKRGVKGAEGKVLASSMVEVMVGDIDMPTAPSDSFNVLTESIDDSDIEEEGWDSALDEIEDDDDDFKVSAKHRIGETETEVIESETETMVKKSDKTPSTKSETSTPHKKKSHQKKKGKKKRAKGKVGHTRGPGIDLE